MARDRYNSLLKRLSPVAPALSTVGLASLCWFASARSLASTQDNYSTMHQQIKQMDADVREIERLKHAPQKATDRERANDELIAQVNAALDAAKISYEHWNDHTPYPAVRIPQTPYKRLSTRLSFTDLSLRELSTFLFSLIDADASLSLSQLHLSAPRTADKENWNIDLTLSYYIFTPATVNVQ